ncbi:MAG: LamG-like jellyroll fold domain-containing protein [Nannocystaceae bacterium]
MNRMNCVLSGACALLLACGDDGLITTDAGTTDKTTTEATSPTASDPTMATTGPSTTRDSTEAGSTTDTDVCPQGEEDCGDGCVQIDGDPEHCGGCRIACDVDDVCVRGSCEPTCDPGKIACDGACVDPMTNDEHCGGCGHECNWGSEYGHDYDCVDGECVWCSDGTPCADFCCPKGWSCTGGCTPPCGPSEADCWGDCTDLNTDPENCGGCGLPCMASGVCVDGVCELPCQVGETACGDVCADLEVDPLHCGDCDTACPMAMIGVSECLNSLCQLTCPDGYLPNDDVSDCTNCGTATIFASQPISYWRLGEPVGMTIAVDQMATKDGAHFELELELPGVASDGDTAARFGNTNLARVNVATYPAMPDAEVSIEFWVDAPDTPGVAETAFSYAVASQNNELMVFNLANINLYIGGASAPTGVNVLDDSWHHVVVTWTSAGGNAFVYVDGVEVYQLLNFQSGYLIKNGGHIALGHEQDGVNAGYDPAQRLIGDLDEVALYDRALGPDEVLAHYNALQGLKCD